MAYYNYKRVANRADFISATVEWSEQTGEEFEGTADYDGDIYCVAEFLLDKKDEEIARLRAELAECRDALAKIGPYYVPSTELSDDEVNTMYAMIDAARKGEETQ